MLSPITLESGRADAGTLLGKKGTIWDAALGGPALVVIS